MEEMTAQGSTNTQVSMMILDSEIANFQMSLRFGYDSIVRKKLPHLRGFLKTHSLARICDQNPFHKFTLKFQRIPQEMVVPKSIPNLT